MKSIDGISLGKRLKGQLRKGGIPVQRVVLFGSVSRNEATEQSDVDIAVIVAPFKKTRWEEKAIVGSVGVQVDPRIEAICLRPEEAEDRYSTLAGELRREGIVC